MKKVKEELIFEWLLEGSISFTKLLEIYVTFLENQRRNDRDQIVELAFLASMLKTPKLNSGAKEDLEKRYTAAIKKSNIFHGTKFEETL